MQCKPVQLPNKLFNGVFIKITASVDAFFDLNDERKVVFFALSDVANEQIMGKQTHCYC
jgi:hypothetical protein